MGLNSDSYNQARGVEIIAHARRCWAVHNAVGGESGVPRLTLFNYPKHHCLALRYGRNPTNTPTNCDCGKAFSTEHALSCAKGGFPTIRHNEIRDLTADLLTEVCNDVRIESDLQPITEETLRHVTANTQEGARLDISANWVWGGRLEKTYFDVRVFNPHAPSNKGSLTACFKKHEREKKISYEQRVRDRTCIIHTFGNVYHWRDGQRGHNLL